jgi:predicted dithiol-disulfide oxidoreductase (DUF899 family)
MSSEKTKTLHEVRFPGESPQYRQAREELLKAEVELRRQIEAVAAKRRKLPLGGQIPHDYVFEEWDASAKAARPVRLSELFEDGKDTLFLYSHMFNPDSSGVPLMEPCPSCTSIIDAIDGAAPHIAHRINFAVSAKAPLERFRAHAKARGWSHARLLSSAKNTYNHDYHAEGAWGPGDANQDPMATVFARRDGKIHHVWSSELYFVPSEAGQDMRHVDFMWPLWSILDTTPEGRGAEWRPELEYS